MVMKSKVRDSNYELLRIVSMFLIVLYHTIFHGNVLKNTTGVLNFTFTCITILTFIHVNCFIIIMGYYQSPITYIIIRI